MDRWLMNLLNEYLIRRMGFDFDGRPKYRISWTTGVTEIRLGAWDIYYGNIFVRTERGSKECLRYPADQNRYVLEMLEFSRNPELPSASQGTYEPLFIFRDAKNNFLRPNMAVLEFMCDKIENPVKRRQSDVDEEEKQEENAEVEAFKDMLAEEGRSVMFEADNSVFLDSTKQGFRE
jgi:hypothetical protein